jgi:hypothetical protein
MINQFQINIFRFAMSNDSEIPCSFCSKWDSKTTSFSCNPEECQKLSEWLFNHAKIMPTETKKVAVLPIHYIV